MVSITEGAVEVAVYRLVVAQILRRRGRSLAVTAAIVVAAVSFSLLSSAVATSRLQVRGTVERNFRTAYDILVRPAHSRTPLERARGLVQENFLSGIYGGITMAQYRQIQQIQGVQVAAPVAMVGYMLPSLYLAFPINKYLTGDRYQAYRLTRTWKADRGLSSYPSYTTYFYINGTRGLRRKVYPPCRTFESNMPTAQSAFDTRALTELACFTTNPPLPGDPGGGLHHGQIAFGVQYYYPVLLAAIDPVQEAKLVGLNQAVISGRYLKPNDRAQTVKVGHGNNTLRYHSVPVLMTNRPLSQDSLSVRLSRLTLPHPSQLPADLQTPDALRWLSGLSGSSVHTYAMSDTSMYHQLLKAYGKPDNLIPTQYWSPNQVTYRHTGSGHLQPVPTHITDPSVWTDMRMPSGFLAPPANADTTFRSLKVHVASNSADVYYGSPIVRQVGVFDPNKIEGFSQLSKVPLTTYYPPDAAPGNPRTARLLHGRPLLPSQNLGGYLQQPPMMLTTLKGLSSFTDPQAFLSTTATSPTTSPSKAPISVIRVRVAGVTGVDKLSQERVRLVAEKIARQTGLQVDVTIGSSPTPQLIDLPAGKYGRPALTLQEGWVQKGVSVKLLSAVDAKSLALFALVLLVCLLFLLNATIAAVRTRRAELGVLACLGWPAKRIFGLLEIELLATGLVAGLIGTGIATGLTATFHLHTTWWQLLLITPVATLLAGTAGVGPAWRACRANPIEAITPAVRAPRRAGKVRSITRLALVGVARWPGRSLLGAASLFIGVAALAILIAIQTAFQGGVAGTLLGNVIAVQVRGVDYLAAALTIGLGAFAVADIAYLNIAERTAEIGTFRASGWTENHLRRLFGTEAVITAGAGAIAGAVVGVTTVAVLFSVPWTTVLTAAAAAAAIGVLAAVLALTLPLVRLTRLAPATAITTE